MWIEVSLLRTHLTTEVRYKLNGLLHLGDVNWQDLILDRLSAEVLASWLRFYLGSIQFYP